MKQINLNIDDVLPFARDVAVAVVGAVPMACYSLYCLLRGGVPENAPGGVEESEVAITGIGSWLLVIATAGIGLFLRLFGVSFLLSLPVVYLAIIIGVRLWIGNQLFP